MAVFIVLRHSHSCLVDLSEGYPEVRSLQKRIQQLTDHLVVKVGTLGTTRLQD